jgi:REP element-mobilizing transposase RayT
MPHNHVAIFLHCIFGTKDRRDSIPSYLLGRLRGYLGGTARGLGFELLAAGGTSNHMHVLFALPPTISAAEAVQKLKANSSRWLGEQGISFEWQPGYGAFSVSPSHVGAVKRYIGRQAEHHKKRSFDEEFGLLLQRCGLDRSEAVVPEGTPAS